MWDAVIIIPRFAFIFLVSIANPFVGSGPNVNICIPAEANPETKAGSRVYPDKRVSFAMMATCFFFLRFLKYVPAAKPNLKNFSPLMTPSFTLPLIPSVPKYFFFFYLIKLQKLKGLV